jgi:hypothetical protein
MHGDLRLPTVVGICGAAMYASAVAYNVTHHPHRKMAWLATSLCVGLPAIFGWFALGRRTPDVVDLLVRSVILLALATVAAANALAGFIDRNTF